MSRIISIGTAVPQHSTDQATILEFMQHAYSDSAASRKLNLLFNHSGISRRYSVVPDFNMNNPDSRLFSEKYLPPEVDHRMTLFKELALPLAMQSIGKLISNFEVTHLISITCTGLYAPGIDSELIEHLGLPDDVVHIPVNFQGCNAVFPALRIADLIAKADENAKVLVVSVELCTLHFQSKNNHDNLLSNTIFGDGSAALLVTSDEFANRNNLAGLSINGFYSLLLNSGKHLMGWNITPNNFEMVLDADVPLFLAENAAEIFFKASQKLNISPAEINYWAIHPGGKKILDVFKRELHLKDFDLWYSYKILDEYGNMSSPTIVFVIEEIVSRLRNPGERIFALGFGPGISIETALFTYVE